MFVAASRGQTPSGEIVRLDRALDKIVPKGAKLEKVFGGMRFIEGPVCVRSGGYLLFSDLVSNAIMKWTPTSSTPEAYRKPVFTAPFPEGVQIGTNGLTLDPQGRLVAAEHGNRRISRTEKNGTVLTLADRYEGKRLNSPNDVVTRKNGDIYFTDPTGLYRSYPDGPGKPMPELDFNGVYRISPGREAGLADQGRSVSNGIAFSPDEKKLYVSSSRPDKF